MESNNWFNTNEYILNGYSTSEQLSNIIRRGIFIDTAPLFVLICGHFDKVNKTAILKNLDANITKNNQERNYSIKDYYAILAFLNSFDLKTTPLLITPQIFTEFIQQLWKICRDKNQFKKILKDYFNPKIHIKDIENYVCSRKFLENQDFLDMNLEIGDVSILICAKIESDKKRARTILTSDTTFAQLSSGRYGFQILFFDEIRNTTLNIQIPDRLLVD